MTPLAPDRGELARFVRALFRHAEEGGIVSLRAFYDDELAKRRTDPPFRIRNVRLNGGGLEPVIEAAIKLAGEAAGAKRPVVVCPPVATFRGNKSSEADLLEGLVLSVELDERAGAGLSTLRAILGPPTVVLESGGEWADPDTGEVQPKLHVHWRLREPASDPAGHAELKRARSLACDLVGADASSKSAVHPMRWAGTLHRKNPDRPKVATIVEENPDAEIALGDALAELEGLAALRAAHEGERADDGARHPGTDPAADGDLLMECARRIANDDRSWDDWVRLGLACFRADDGGEAGFRAFDEISRKSPKYDAANTRARWEHFRTSPPDWLGVGTLVWEARKADPTFRRRKPAENLEGEVAPDEEWVERLARAIDELNRLHFVADMGAQTVILSPSYDETLGRERLLVRAPSDFKLKYAHRHYTVAVSLKGNEITKDLGTAWISDWRRRTYDRAALIPKGPVPPDVYNLWRGFGVTPVQGEWPRFRDHLLDVICAGNEAHLAYLLGWCAYCVQHPERQAEVAVVLRGKKGAGKGTFGQVMMDVFRGHSLQITQGKHLTGHFNAHLVDVLFLFVDEALWAGDRQGEGALKGLVTERTVTIEPKGVDPFPAPNRLKILMASNNDWVVPATADERRYFVLDVGDERCGDRTYFKELHAALDAGERSAFFHHILNLDLGGFEIRDAPHTEGLNRQKVASAEPHEAFWYDCLWEGSILGAGDDDWPEEIAPQKLHAAYIDHAKNAGHRYTITLREFGRKLKEMSPGAPLKRVRPRDDGAERRKLGEKPPKRPRYYQLGTLTQHRAAFLEAMRIDPEGHPWPRTGDDA